MPIANRKPNWQKWKNVPAVQVWEAAALSLDIEPIKVKFHPQGWMAGDNGHVIHTEGQEFEDRLDVLRRNLARDKLLAPARIVMGSADRSEIELGPFVVWCARAGWTIPDALRQLARSPVTRPPAEAARVELATEPLIATPEKITLAWIWTHVPVTWIWALGGIVVAAIGLGYSIGRSEIVSRTVDGKPAQEDAAPKAGAALKNAENPTAKK